MNRTLLLILCDFLLLTLLALTDWQKAAPAKPVPPPPPAARPATGAGAATQDDDLVAVMKLSLADERTQRDQVAQQLQSTQSTLSEREKTLADTTTSLDATRQKADTLAQQ
jgi:hypothetical protein